MKKKSEEKELDASDTEEKNGSDTSFVEKVSLSEEYNSRMGKIKNKQLLELFLIIAITSLVFLVTWGQLNSFSANTWVFFVLININAILMLVVLFLVARNVIKLILERKRKVFGAKLRTRLVFAFISVSFLPIVLMFLATNKIITTSVNYWFTSQVENSMQAALDVGKSFYNTAVLRLKANADLISDKLSVLPQEDWQDVVLRNKKENNLILHGIVYFADEGNNYVSYQEDVWFINPEFVPIWKLALPSINFVNAAANGLEPLLWGDDNGDYVISTVPLKGYKGYFIISAELIGKGLINQLGKISDGFEEYEALKNLKQPLKFSFSLILGLLSLIVLFASVWLGFRLSREIVQPILALSKGTKQIAEGDWNTQVEDRGKDELGKLVDSFNAMAKEVYHNQEKLKILNTLIENQNKSLMDRNQYIEAILEHVTAGVITLNKDGVLITMNKAASDIFQIRPERYLGLSVRTVLGGSYTAIIDEMYAYVENNPAKTWFKEVEIIRKGKYLKILVQAVPLNSFIENIPKNMGDSGYVVYEETPALYGSLVVVLEDITELSQEQRLAAWKEVAKRIAHEIKNPLTPIKLSVERIEKKFGASIDDPVFKQCTSLIIKEVNRIQNMVSDFSGFAVMPNIDLKKDSLLPLLQDLLEVFKISHAKIQWRLEISGDIPDIMLDKKSMQRALYNILSNAAEAILAKNSPPNNSPPNNSPAEEGIVLIRVYCSHSLSETFVVLDIIDNGKGLDEEEIARLFEPYFSKKPAGTGLGLAIVQSVITDHHGTITAKQEQGKTVIEIRLPLAQ